MAVLLLICAFGLLLIGYPVGLSLGGVAVLFALGGVFLGAFDAALLIAIPSRLYGIITNPVLTAIPLFVLMGVALERSGLAQRLFRSMARDGSPVSLLLGVTGAGTILAASSGVVGASIVALGMLALPPLLKAGVDARLATGSVAAAGTLGQIVPPSIVLIILGDQMSNAYQTMQTARGDFAPDTVSVSDLFAGAVLPGLLLASLFALYQFWALRRAAPVSTEPEWQGPGSLERLKGIAPPLLLILLVPGSILTGIATPTEAAALGAFGVVLLWWFLGERDLSPGTFSECLREAARLTGVIFLIVIGASLFALVFRGYGGDGLIEGLFAALPGGTMGALVFFLALLFVLGCFLEFIEIIYITVPLMVPVLLAMPLADGAAMHPIWLAVLVAMVLQTSFLTPPMGISLFYLRSVAADTISTTMIYRGALPFIALQVLALVAVLLVPQLALWPLAWFGL